MALKTNLDYYVRIKDPFQIGWLQSEINGDSYLEMLRSFAETNSEQNKFRVWKVFTSAGQDPSTLHYGDVVQFGVHLQVGNEGPTSTEADIDPPYEAITVQGEDDSSARMLICSDTTYCIIDDNCLCEQNPQSSACDCNNLVKGPDYGKPVCLGMSVIFCILGRDYCPRYIYFDMRDEPDPNVNPHVYTTDQIPGCKSGKCPSYFQLIPANLMTCDKGNVVPYTDFDNFDFNCTNNNGCGYCYTGNNYIFIDPNTNCKSPPSKPAEKFYSCCSKDWTCKESSSGTSLNECQLKCISGAKFTCADKGCFVDFKGTHENSWCNDSQGCDNLLPDCKDTPPTPPNPINGGGSGSSFFTKKTIIILSTISISIVIIAIILFTMFL